MAGGPKFKLPSPFFRSLHGDAETWLESSVCCAENYRWTPPDITQQL